DRGAPPERCEAVARTGEHLRREVDGDPARVRESIEDRGEEQPVAGDEVDYPSERDRGRAEQAEEHVDLHVRMRDTGGAGVAERGSDAAVAPDVGIHSRSRTRRPISRHPMVRSPGPPRSAVRCPAATTAATARAVASAAAGHASEYRQSIAADRMAASGFARSCPAMSGAEP